MNWSNLKEERCPKCGAYLHKASSFICLSCDFSISFDKAHNYVGPIKDLEKEATRLINNSKKK